MPCGKLDCKRPIKMTKFAQNDVFIFEAVTLNTFQ